MQEQAITTLINDFMSELLLTFDILIGPPRLGPRAFSFSVVDSLGRGGVLFGNTIAIHALI